MADEIHRAPEKWEVFYSAQSEAPLCKHDNKYLVYEELPFSAVADQSNDDDADDPREAHTHVLPPFTRLPIFHCFHNSASTSGGVQDAVR